MGLRRSLSSPLSTLWGTIMAMVVRIAGDLMLAYSAPYTSRFIFYTLCDAQPVWNVVSAACITIAQAANFAHMRAQSGQQVVTVSRLGAYASLWCQRRPDHPVLSQLGSPACSGGGRIGKRPLGRHLARHCRSSSSRPGYDGMAALPQIGSPAGVEGIDRDESRPVRRCWWLPPRRGGDRWMKGGPSTPPAG